MPAQNKLFLAFLILIVGNFFATFVDVIVKWLATDVSVFQYLFLRQLAVLTLLFPFWMKLPKYRKTPGNIKVHFVRAILTNIGAPSAVIALIYLPLATANVFFYTAPMLTVLFASLLLKEKVQFHRMAVALIGLTGVVVALRPEYFNFAGMLALCTALAVAGYNLSVRWLPKGSSTVNTIMWSNLVALPITGVIAAFNWQVITADLLLLAAGSCCFLVIYQGCCIVAFQQAEAGAIAVAEYSGLVFAAILGWLIFEEELDNWTFIGIGLIIVPMIWQSWFENNRQLKAAQSLTSIEIEPR